MNKVSRVEDIKGSVDVACSDQLDSDTLNIVSPYAVAQFAEALSKLYQHNTAEAMIAMLESIVGDLHVDMNVEEEEGT